MPRGGKRRFPYRIIMDIWASKESSSLDALKPSCAMEPFTIQTRGSKHFEAFTFSVAFPVPETTSSELLEGNIVAYY